MKYDTDGLLKRNNLTQEVLQQMMGYSAMNDGNDENAKKVFQKLINSDIPVRFAKRNIYNDFLYRKMKKAAVVA